MPIIDVRLRFRCMAWAFGANPVSASARCTRSFVFGFRPGWPFSTRDTVVRASPTCRAKSAVDRITEAGLDRRKDGTAESRRNMAAKPPPCQRTASPRIRPIVPSEKIPGDQGRPRLTRTTVRGRSAPTNPSPHPGSTVGGGALPQKVAVAAGGSAGLDVNLTSGAYSEVLQLNAFVVGSTREGNAKTIVEQRQAPNVKTIIASDAFGAVSEDNVGEFLKYMSGRSIDYVENDARQVRVRGLSAKYASSADFTRVANGPATSV